MTKVPSSLLVFPYKHRVGLLALDRENTPIRPHTEAREQRVVGES